MLLAVALTAILASEERPKLMVLELTASGVEAQVARVLTDTVATEVTSRHYFDVVSAKDMQTLVGIDRQRQLVGCSDDSRCLTELAGALGARFVVSGQVGKLGDAYQLSLEGLDTLKAKPLGRSTRIARDLTSLRAQIPYAVAEATGVPLPEPPSRWLPYSTLALGAAALLAGGYFGVDGLSREGQIRATLQAGKANQTPLASLSFYKSQAGASAQEKTVSLALLGVGAALVGAGLFLNPQDAGAKVAVFPLPQGVAFAVVLP